MQEEVKKEKTIEELNAITDRIVDCFFSVHRTLGPGFPEAIYHASLRREFDLNDIAYKTEVEIPVFYKGFDLQKTYRLDLLVEDEIIVELKTVDDLHTVHQAQLLSYLKMTGKRLGYLANFKVAMMKEGIKRVRLDSGTKHVAPPKTYSRVVHRGEAKKE